MDKNTRKKREKKRKRKMKEETESSNRRTHLPNASRISLFLVYIQVGNLNLTLGQA